VAATCAKL
ncbi:hypothetical protein A2U01_0117267, partial [Trifolium medium]|nr:hypothetical protein [Trifolium medium]